MPLPAPFPASAPRLDRTPPFLTFYDDASGERTELSLASLDNWVAKIAGVLQDELGLPPSARLGIDLPAHWQTAALLLSAWTVGLTVVMSGTSDVDALAVGPEAQADASGPDLLVVSLHPLGAALPAAPAPPGLDLLAAARAMPDSFVPLAPPRPDAAALVVAGATLSLRRLSSAASALPLGPTERVLSVLGYDQLAGLLAGLLGPLVAGASIVLCSRPDVGRLDQRAATEHVTVTAGARVGTLPELPLVTLGESAP